MADKLTPLIFTALSRAAANPPSVPLFTTKATMGLFPCTTTAKLAANRCLADGLLTRITTDLPAKPTAELVCITTKGLAYLQESQNPKSVLEDIARALEVRSAQADEWIASARTMIEHLAGLKATLHAMLPNVSLARVSKLPEQDLKTELLAALNAWTGGAGEDCPLPELFRRLTSPPSLGLFHDTLRMLRRAGQLHLHPWTGPLYTLPEPEFALVLGHEVVYYASPIVHSSRKSSSRAMTEVLP